MFIIYCGTQSNGRAVCESIDAAIAKAEDILALRLTGWSIGTVRGAYCPFPGAPITRETSLRIEVSETTDYGMPPAEATVRLAAYDLGHAFRQDSVLVERVAADSRVAWSRAEQLAA